MWEGPYTWLNMQGETCTVLLPPPSGSSHFQTTVVKRFIADRPHEVEKQQDQPEKICPSCHDSHNFSYGDMELNISLYSGIISTISSKLFSPSWIPQSPDKEKYASSRRKEIHGLFERGVFSTGHKASAEGLRISGSRFFHHFKHEGTPYAFEKSRLVMQGFKNNQCFLTHAPTVQRASQRLLLPLGICDKSFKAISRDVSQA